MTAGVKGKPRDLYHIIGSTQRIFHAKYEGRGRSRDLGISDFRSENRQNFKKKSKIKSKYFEINNVTHMGMKYCSLEIK